MVVMVSWVYSSSNSLSFIHYYVQLFICQSYLNKGIFFLKKEKLVLALGSCVILSKFLNLSEPQFPFRQRP